MLSKYEADLIEFFGQLSAQSLVFGLDWDSRARLLRSSKVKLKLVANAGLLLSGGCLLTNSAARLYRIFGSIWNLSYALLVKLSQHDQDSGNDVYF